MVVVRNEMNLCECKFCGGSVRFAYNMGTYDLGHCKKCGTIGVLNLPNATDLAEFYQGFNFQTNVANYARVNSSAMKCWMESLLSGRHGRMLDLGGRRRFFCEEF